MLASLLAALAVSASGPVLPSSAQVAASTAQAAPSPDAVDLGEINVEGRRLEELTRDFVREVAAPSRNRGLARWRDGVCIGVANLQNDIAQYVVDRVSTVAEDVGLNAGRPGCTPTILVVAVADANAFTPDFVAKRPRLFRVGGAGMDRGGDALERFKTNDHPVRWWVVTAPVDNDTGDIAVRLPGFSFNRPTESDPSGDSPMNFAPNIAVRSASRLSTQIVDDTQRVFVIVDVDKLKSVTTQQLADYVAFVSLAQIDPEADTSGYASVLNVFDDPDQTSGLTQWDTAYLQGLYATVRTRKDVRANSLEIVDSIVRTRRQMATVGAD